MSLDSLQMVLNIFQLNNNVESILCKMKPSILEQLLNNLALNAHIQLLSVMYSTDFKNSGI
jgi:hypothetical protein